MKTKMKKMLGYLKSLGNNRLTQKIALIFLGVSSTIWFLIRVIPKPQRATYPCMRVAAPFISTLVVYLLSLWGTAAAYKQAKKYFKLSRYLMAGVFLIGVMFFLGVFLTQNSRSVLAYENVLEVNSPVGAARGIFPGKVSWVFNPGVAKFDGETGFWWDDSNTVQAETDKLLTEAVLDVTGKKNEKKAWDALFEHFNSTKRDKKLGYTAGEKIAIKINQNNTFSHEDNKNINASPHLILSLLKSMINEAGIPQNCITVFDNSRFITDNIYDKCHAEFPDVFFVDNIGGNGRVKSTYELDAMKWSSENNKSIYTGIASCAVEADYLINMAILKGHQFQGVTLCAKNWFGATNIHNDFHLNKGAHYYFSANREGKDTYMTFADFMGHKDLGEKTMLFLVDAIYGQNSVSGVPHLKWQMKPFNNRWPSSLFASQDGVAIDAVGIDFLRSEWPDMPDLQDAEKYLIEAAQADNPPSKTFYDPEKDGIKCKSLGVMETWNSYEQKQYSRNLGANLGIDLNFVDLTVSKRVRKYKNE